MKPTQLLAIIFAVALLGLVPAVALAERPSNYFLAKGGIYDPSKEFDLNNIDINFHSKTGFAGEGAFGHYFLPWLALELGAGYFESKGTAAQQAGEAKLQVVPVVLTGKVLAQLGPVVEPYLEGGIGAYLSNFDVSAATSNVNGSTKVSYGLHAGAGINFNITDIFLVGAEGRYLWSEPDFGGADVNLDGFIITGNLGVRF